MRISKLILAKTASKGFALPTILIASIVMLTVLLVSVSSTSSVRTVMKSQYYEQLAQVAGEAGVAYAEACLAANGNVPLWSNANPLQPNTNCSGVETVACPVTAGAQNVLCAVTRNGNIRSNFSVGLPTGYVAGDKLETIPNNGFVEVLRKSSGVVWRTYQQKTSPTTTVPDLCSGVASTALGWNKAIVRTGGGSFPESTADAISTSTGNINPGVAFFRKDFSVANAGVHQVDVFGDDIAEVIIDGQLIATSTQPTYTAVNTTLEVGCHTAVVKVTNNGILQNGGLLKLSIKKSGSSSPIVVTDTSWRTTSGNAVHYSMPSYFVSSAWMPARDIQAYNGTTVWTTPISPAWNTQSGNTTARRISTTHSYANVSDYPVGYALFRDNQAVTVSTPTEVKITYACDDICGVWLDGTEIATSAGHSTARTTTLTLSEGEHQLAASLNNAGVGAGGVIIAMVRTADNVTLSQSTGSWLTSNAWYATEQNPYSYDNTFQPNPRSYSCTCSDVGTTNMTTNPSFETDINDWGGGRATIARSTAALQTGAWGARMTVNAVGFFPRAVAFVPVSGGEIYTLSAYVKSAGMVRIGYQYLSPAGVGLGSSLGTAVASSNVWTRVSIATEPTPASADRLQIWIGIADNSALNTIFDVDAVMMTPGTTVFNYGDGTKAGWKWLGTTNNSVSSGPAL